MVGKSISNITVHPDSAKISAGNFVKNTWHSDNLSYYPNKSSNFENLDELAKEFIFKKYGPNTPIFNKTDTIVTLGSCFADRLRNWLKANKIGSSYISVPEGLNNSFAVRQYLEWAITGDRSSDAYWYDNDSILGAYKYEPKEEQSTVLKHMKSVKGIVVTFGLSEVWRDIETNNVFWRGVPASEYDNTKHKCETSTVDENIKNMKEIIELIHKNLGKDKVIIFTLSPVPLNATFTENASVIGDCISKSILRVALHELFKINTNENVFYWPSFEMVRWVGAHTNTPTLFEDNTTRHVNNNIVKIIIDNFIEKFFI